MLNIIFSGIAAKNIETNQPVEANETFHYVLNN